MFQVFVSTFVVCTLTALAILTAGLVDLDTGRVAFSAPVEQLAGAAFASAFGPLGPVFLGVHRGPVRLVLHFGVEPVRCGLLDLSAGAGTASGYTSWCSWP